MTRNFLKCLLVRLHNVCWRELRLVQGATGHECGLCAGCFYAWGDAAAGDVVAALLDDSWRVREMTAKVVAAQKVMPATTEMILLQEDQIHRVRRGAGRALRRLGT